MAVSGHGGNSVFYDSVMQVKNEKRKMGVDYYYNAKYEDEFNDFGFFSSDISDCDNVGGVVMSYERDTSATQPEAKGSFGFNGLSAFGGIDFTKVAAGEEAIPEQEPVCEPEPETKPEPAKREDSLFDFFDEFTQTGNYAVPEPAPTFSSQPEPKNMQTLFGDYNEDRSIDFEDDVEEFEDFAPVITPVATPVTPPETKPVASSATSSRRPSKDTFKEGIYKGRATKSMLVACGIFIAFIALFIISVIFNVNYTLGNGTVYDGVLVNGANMGGMTKEQVREYVQKNYVDPINNANITITLGDAKKVYGLSTFVTCPDAAEIAEQAYSVARTGSTSERRKQIQSLKDHNKNISVAYEITSDRLDEVVSSATNISFSEAINPRYEITGDSVAFYGGKFGTTIDKGQFQMDIYEALNEFKEEIVHLGDGAVLENMELEIGTDLVSFKMLSPQDIYDEVYVAAKNAYYYRDSSTGNILVASEQSGKTVDLAELNALVSRINMGEEIFYEEVKIQWVSAGKTAYALRSRLFETTLSSGSTENTEDVYSEISWVGVDEREKNFKTIAEKFGTVTLLPGEKVDFIAALGTVNGSAGFVEAYENIYNGGEKILGGGISQAATLLYSAAIRSGLSVTQHKNNPYLPNYGVPGFDAYVSRDNSAGLIVKNSTDYPVKITMSYDGGAISVRIEGTDEGYSNVTFNVEREDKSAHEDGTLYTYTVSTIVGTKEQDPKTVSYIKHGEEYIPETTELPTDSTEDPSATPDNGTDDPSEKPTDEIDDDDSSESPTRDPNGSEEPLETPSPSGSADPTETPSGGQTAMPTPTSRPW